MKRILGMVRGDLHRETGMKAKVFSSWKDVGISHDELEKELNAFLNARLEREKGASSPPVVKAITQSESRAGAGPVSLTVIVWYE
jgi:hypothetical protein